MYEYVCSPLCNENKVCFYNTQIAYYFIQKNNELRSPQDSVNKIMILLNPRLTANPTPEFLSKANVRILTKLSSLRTKAQSAPPQPLPASGLLYSPGISLAFFFTPIREGSSLFTRNKEYRSRLNTLPMGLITPQQSQHLK